MQTAHNQNKKHVSMKNFNMSNNLQFSVDLLSAAPSSTVGVHDFTTLLGYDYC